MHKYSATYIGFDVSDLDFRKTIPLRSRNSDVRPQT